MSEISLKSLIKESAQVTEEFPGYEGFEVTLCYPGRKELNNIRKACTVQKINRKTRQVEDELDEDKFLQKYVEAVIKNWKGFTVAYLQELALVDTGTLDPTQEIPFNVENAITLMQNSPSFDSWITEVSTDLENFTQHK